MIEGGVAVASSHDEVLSTVKRAREGESPESC